MIQQYEKKWPELPWKNVRDSVEVKLFTEEGELYVLAKSEGRRAKERAMRRNKLVRFLRKLRAMRRNPPTRDQLLRRIGAAKKDAGKAARFVVMKVPPEGVAVTRQSFAFGVDQEKLKQAELRDGLDVRYQAVNSLHSWSQRVIPDRRGHSFPSQRPP
jgi:hypothetical protein